MRPRTPSGRIEASRAGAEASESAGAQGGLVSVQTTGKRAPEHQATRLAAEAMRAQLGGFIPAARASRVARMRRGVGFSARAHLAERPGFRSDRVAMVTATYRAGAEWKPGHVKAWLTHVRKWCQRRGLECRYVWVAELQEKRASRSGEGARAVVHYHVALWLPYGVNLPFSDAQGWWPHGDTRTEWARAAVPYLMKYMSKGSDRLRLPHGCRMHGAGGLEHSMRRAKRWLGLPGFVRARSDVHDDWRHVRGGGWLVPEGDFVVPSEFRRAWLGDGWGLIRVHDYGRPFQADGPFTWLKRGS